MCGRTYTFELHVVQNGSKITPVTARERARERERERERETERETERERERVCVCVYV